MNKSERDKSGLEFSAQAATALEDINFTADGAGRFFRQISKKRSVELSRFRMHFFLRGNKVCVSQNKPE